MSKLTKKEKMRRYHAIYDQIYLNPRIHVHEISKNLRLARNTVSGYLEYMYELQILFGPELRLKYYPSLNRYMYLAKFDDPYTAFDELQRDEEVIYCSLFLGDWNIMFMSEGNYDPSIIGGFEHLLFRGERRDMITPRVPLSEWRPAFERMRSQISDFDPSGAKETDPVSNGPPPWDDEEWKLFHEYEYDFRRKVTPVLRKHLISSDKFYKWLGILPSYTNVLLRFYPDGYGNYTHFAFLLKTNYTEAVVSLLSNLPTTTICTEVEGGIMVMLSIKSDMTFTDLSSTIHRMKASGMIRGFHQAIGVVHYAETAEGYAQLR